MWRRQAPKPSLSSRENSQPNGRKFCTGLGYFSRDGFTCLVETGRHFRSAGSSEVGLKVPGRAASRSASWGWGGGEGPREAAVPKAADSAVAGLPPSQTGRPPRAEQLRGRHPPAPAAPAGTNRRRLGVLGGWLAAGARCLAGSLVSRQADSSGVRLGDSSLPRRASVSSNFSLMLPDTRALRIVLDQLMAGWSLSSGVWHGNSEHSGPSVTERRSCRCTRGQRPGWCVAPWARRLPEPSKLDVAFCLMTQRRSLRPG